MKKRTAGTISPAFTAKVAVPAIKGEKTLAELAPLHDVQPNHIAAWKAQLIEAAAGDLRVPNNRQGGGARGRSEGSAREDR